MARFIVGHRLRALGDRHAWLQRLLYRLDRCFFGALLGILRLLPLDTASRLGAAIGGALGPRFRKGSAIAANLRVALPELDEAQRARVARDAWANAGALFAEYAHLPDFVGGHARDRLEVEVAVPLRACAEPAKPAIFVAAHMANWELIAGAVHRLGLPLACVYTPPTNPLLDELLHRWRAELGCELLPREDSMRPMIRALAAGRSLGIVADRRVDSGRPVMLFGHPKPTSIIPARLALRFDCELVPVRVERLAGARFRVSFHAPVAHAAGSDEIERAVLMTEQVHRLFEGWIRARPGDWFCSKRLWPKPVYAALRQAA